MIPQLRKSVDFFREKIFNQFEANFWVAGGAVRDYFLSGSIDHSVDIDLFFPGRHNWEKVKKSLVKRGYEISFESDNSLKMTKDNTTYDLVKIYQHDPKATIYTFDFTICCCAISRHGIYHHETFFIDLLQKRLVVNDLHKPFNTMSRIRKYIMKGFYIDNENLFKVMKAVREAPENTVPTLIRETCINNEDVQEILHQPLAPAQDNNREVPECNEIQECDINGFFAEAAEEPTFICSDPLITNDTISEARMFEPYGPWRVSAFQPQMEEDDSETQLDTESPRENILIDRGTVVTTTPIIELSEEVL